MCPYLQRIFYFNPRARVGRDARLVLLQDAQDDFNPRARVGRDGRGQPLSPRLLYFNPRARVGRDGDLDGQSFLQGISIHAPA
mgnify:CR=1 FL=1